MRHRPAIPSAKLSFPWYAALLLCGLVTATPVLQAEEPAQAVYLGAGVCISCHGAQDLGNQAARWTGSPHARTYLVLATGYPAMIPEQARGLINEGLAGRIREAAQRLGQESDCLACHTTAAGVDESLKAESFHIEDGVQCEACHGPGSLHVAARRSRAAAGQGLPGRLTVPDGCLRCHREKQSHAVLGRKPFNPEKAWQRIAHPRPTR